MIRGDLYRVSGPTGRDPKKFRVYAVVSRQALIDSKWSTVICAPVYSARQGLLSQVDVGADEGLRYDSAINCDALMSLPKSSLTHFVGRLAPARLPELDRALAAALAIDPAALDE